MLPDKANNRFFLKFNLEQFSKISNDANTELVSLMQRAIGSF